MITNQNKNYLLGPLGLMWKCIDKHIANNYTAILQQFMKRTTYLKKSILINSLTYSMENR